MNKKIRRLKIEMSLFDKWYEDLLMLAEMFGVSLINRFAWIDCYINNNSPEDTFINYIKING